MPEEIELNVHVEQGAGAVAQGKVYKPDLAQSRIAVLQPFTTFTTTVKPTPAERKTWPTCTSAFSPIQACRADICSPEYADATGESSSSTRE